ncbi:MAG: HTTM domain-containing protein [Acidimicrobiia bacterium]
MSAVVTSPPTTSWLDDVFDRPGSVRTLALLRLVLGPVVLVHLWPFLAMTSGGRTYRDTFFEPWWGFAPVPPGWVQVVLVWTGAVAAVALAAGWRTRLVGPLTWLCVAGNLFLSQHHFRHNRAFLLFLLGAVALADSGRVLSVDSLRRRLAGRPVDDRATLWPLWLLRALAASVYLASGISKLVDRDWVGGLVLWDRAVRHQHLVHDRLPDLLADPVVDLVTARWVHAITSPIAVAMELFIGLGLWFGRTRLAAIWTAVFFHVSIELSASVEVFSLAAIAALVIWAEPSTRDRVVVTHDGRWIRRLDWLARFDVREVPGAPLAVTDRDGTVRTGDGAAWLVRSRLPLLFPFVAPAHAVRSVRRRTREAT